MGFEMKPEKDLNSSKSSHQCKSKNKKNKNKKKMMMTWRQKKIDSMVDEITAVKTLFNTCKQVFFNGAPGLVPSQDQIQRLRLVLDNMKPEDVGLSPAMPYFRSDDQSPGPVPVPVPITYLHLHQCDQFSIGIFCLPPSGVIPLHNHPGMTVFSKILFGSMHIKSYDWVANAPMRDSKTRLAKKKVDSTFTAPCETSILYPEDGGNMHRFTAMTACAVLDVLGPPYCNPEGRHCTYFIDFPYDSFSSSDDAVLRSAEEKESHVWLQERDDNPEDLNVVGALYTGPNVED